MTIFTWGVIGYLVGILVIGTGIFMYLSWDDEGIELLAIALGLGVIWPVTVFFGLLACVIYALADMIMSIAKRRKHP